MKKYMIAFTIILTALVVGFFFAPSHPRSEGEQLAGRVLSKAAPILSARHHMHACGTYLSCPDGPLQGLGLHFQACKAMSQDEARTVVLDCARTILEILYADGKVRDAVAHYPFRLEDVNAVIFMSDARGNDLYAPDFWCAGLSKGTLTFSSNDPGNVSECSDGSVQQLGKERPSIYEVIEKWVEPKDREDTQMIGKREQPNPDGKG